MSERVLLLIGSPGNLRSNSNQLGQYLVGRLGDAGWDVDTECVCQAVRGEDVMRSVIDKIDGSDLVILSFPLYVDSLPAPMIRFLEIVNDHRKGVEKMDRRMMAVCQSGFPESHNNDCALRVCSIFARGSGFRWVGGLAVGGGGAIGGKALQEGGAMLRNLRKALDLTAMALIDGKDVPSEAKELTNKGIAPPWLYNRIVNRIWKRDARKNGVDPRWKPQAQR